MTLATFTPPVPPSIGYQNKPEVKILKAEFGDGYTQAAANGINHIRRVVSLKWEWLYAAEALAITSFLEAHGGYMPFEYTEPGSATPKKWTCEDWTDTTNERGFHAVTATFRQSFNLANPPNLGGATT